MCHTIRGLHTADLGGELFNAGNDLNEELTLFPLPKGCQSVLCTFSNVSNRIKRSHTHLLTNRTVCALDR